MIPTGPDLSTAELCETRSEGPNPKARFKVKVRNGEATGWVVLEMEVVLGSCYQIGFDPTTGVPAVTIQSSNVVRVVECEPSVRRRSTTTNGKAPERGYA